MTSRFLRWALRALLAVLALLLVGTALATAVGWNWARGQIERSVLQHTGRELHIDGDLALHWGWPAPRLSAQRLRFANPGWATAPQMLTAERAEVGIDLRALLQGRLAFTEVQLTQPQIHLERAADGRRSWLLDPAQSDDEARIRIGRLALDKGTLGYDDTRLGTHIRAELSTAPGADATLLPLVFSAGGSFKGVPLQAQGRSGAVLALRDASQPYPLRAEATLGRTKVRAEGTVTSLLALTALDLELVLSGDSVAALTPLLGIALPPTRPYSSSGRLLRRGSTWRYEGFSGRVGGSDIAGSLQVETAGPKPVLSGELASRRLDLADLGPAVGADRASSVQAPGPEQGQRKARALRTARTAQTSQTAATADASEAAGAAGAAPRAPAVPGRVLPDLPFDPTRWGSLDADVLLRADAMLGEPVVAPTELTLRVLLKDSVLALDPLSFAMAGGQVSGRLTLDGRQLPLKAEASAQLRGLQLGRLLPALAAGAAAPGRVDGQLALRGQGASVGRLLASADGRVSLVAQGGQLSRLLVETSGLHLLEILQLRVLGDEAVALNCAVADFSVVDGQMRASALLLDTARSTLHGSGSIDLAQERFDLQLQPTTKMTSLVALRSPIHVRGSFAAPQVAVDTKRVLARGAGALALGLVNPLLALVPLLESGPGVDGECARLVSAARAPAARPAAVRPPSAPGSRG
jgi:AsmA protein